MEAKELLTRIGRVQFHMGDDQELFIAALSAMCQIFYPVGISRSKDDSKMWEYVGYCSSFKKLKEGGKPPLYDMMFKTDENGITSVIKVVKR